MRASTNGTKSGGLAGSLTSALRDTVSAAVAPVVSGVLWRIGMAIAVLGASFAAVYQLTVAGTMALELEFGAIQARLIVAGVYAAIVLAAVMVMRLKSPQRRLREKRDAAVNAALDAPRHLQIAMLIDAALAGFSAGKATAKS